jgi:hypothetical protein
MTNYGNDERKKYKKINEDLHVSIPFYTIPYPIATNSLLQICGFIFSLAH